MIILRISNNTILKAFGVLVSGSIIANLLTILISPIITRIYTAEEFGLYTLIITVLSFAGPVLCLKLDMSIISALTKREKYAAIIASFLTMILVSFVIAGLYSYFVFYLSYSFSFLTYFFITFLLLVLYGLNLILLACNNRDGMYGLMSQVTIIRSVSNNSLLLILGKLSFGVSGMVISHLTSSSLGVWRQSKNLRKNYRYLFLIKSKDIINLFKKHKHLIYLNTPSAFISTALYSSINIFVGIVYSSEMLGYYALSYRVLGIPLIIISSNISRIFYEKALKEKHAHGNFQSVFNSTMKILFVIVIPLILSLGLISPMIFPYIFGEGWGTAGIFVSILTPMFVIRLVSESLLSSFIVANKQSIELKYQSFILLSQVLIYFSTFILKLDIHTFLILISLMYFITHSFLLMIMYHLSKRKD